MIDPENVPDVEDEETLARFVLHRSHIRSSDQTVKPDAFIPHPHRELSVTRHRLATEDDLWSVGHGVAASTGKSLRGRADVDAKAFVAQSLEVKAAPVPGNPNHADVVGWPTDKPLQKIIALEIAATARFRIPA